MGQRWEIALNTYKPFACGIVIHPAIDACVQLRNRHGLSADQVARIVVRAHPLVQELTGKKTPATGLESKFSVYHSCAVAIIHGRAGEHEYEDAVVNDPAVLALRSRVELVVDPAIHEASVDVRLETVDGRTLALFVERAVGSLEQPMSHAQLADKFIDQAAPVLGLEQARRGWELSLALASQPDLQPLLSALTPAA
ncbi:MAG: MmgE/PrpD family protein [Rhodoferax sp.]|nr:MmgE/PrpD family protein [Rhodoferax sp.]